MAKIRRPTDIEYLVFQGGGGKGVAYAGVLKALEEKEVLPFKPGAPREIKGIAGTSAGAITALLVSMGYTSDEIDEKYLTKPEVFNAFFDGPDNGSYRTVSYFNIPGRSDRSINIDLNETVEDFIKKSRDLSTQNPIVRTLAVSLLGFMQSNTQYQGLLKEPAHEVLFMLLKGSDTTHHTNALVGKFGGTLLKSVIDLVISQLVASALPDTSDEERNAIWGKIKESIHGFVYNLLFDRGVFPGFSVRNFFVKAIEDRFKELFNEKIDGGRINFETFYKYTKCNLIFTGVNVMKHKFQYFSKDHTPDFPVAEAAAISMNLPGVFKPVYVEGGELEGLWIDGGTVNNLPLHAFDYTEKRELLERYHEELYAYLHPGTLAFSLVPSLDGKEKEETKSWTDLFPFFDFVVGVLNRMWDPSESQVKREVEREQIIRIPYGELSTLNFTPKESVKKEPIQQAYDIVMDYFKRL